MLDIPNASKAAVAQTAVATLLTYAGYRVVPYGIEAQCPELTFLDAAKYQSLAVPDVLRHTPDLLVFSPSENALVALEIKFTRNWSAEMLRLMLAKLQRQQTHFPETHTVILRAAGAAGEPAADDLARVLPPHQLLLLATAQVLGDASVRAGTGAPAADPLLEPIWQRLQRLDELFPALVASDGWSEVLLRILPALGRSSSGE